jgi:hypothetical protein
MKNHGKYMACRKIQKFLRGFIVYKEMYGTFLQMKLYGNFEFFSNIKDKMMEDA